MTGARTHSIERTGRTARNGRSGSARVATAAVLMSIVAAAVTVTPAQAQAQAAPVDGSASAPHVRPEADVRDLVAEAARRSEEIRRLIERLEGSQVTVYVRARSFAQTDLDGRVALLAATRDQRYLVIEIACGRPRLTQMATLGHELYHAVEIAAEPSVVDAQTLAALYTRIGRRTDYWGGRMMFETEAAADAGMRARRELFTNTTKVNSTRRANGS